MDFCPFTKDECKENCGLYDEPNDRCAILLTAKVLGSIKREVQVAASALNNIAISVEDMNS